MAKQSGISSEKSQKMLEGGEEKRKYQAGQENILSNGGRQEGKYGKCPSRLFEKLGKMLASKGNF